MPLQKLFEADGITHHTRGRVREVSQTELKAGGVYATDRATSSGANSNYGSRALQFCRDRWQQSGSGIPFRRFVIVGNHCVQRGVDLRAESTKRLESEAPWLRETTLWSVIIYGSMENLATNYQTLARSLGTASQVI